SCENTVDSPITTRAALTMPKSAGARVRAITASTPTWRPVYAALPQAAHAMPVIVRCVRLGSIRLVGGTVGLQCTSHAGGKTGDPIAGLGLKGAAASPRCAAVTRVIQSRKRPATTA